MLLSAVCQILWSVLLCTFKRSNAAIRYSIFLALIRWSNFSKCNQFFKLHHVTWTIILWYELEHLLRMGSIPFHTFVYKTFVTALSINTLNPWTLFVSTVDRFVPPSPFVYVHLRHHFRLESTPENERWLLTLITRHILRQRIIATSINIASTTAEYLPTAQPT